MNNELHFSEGYWKFSTNEAKVVEVYWTNIFVFTIGLNDIDVLDILERFLPK